MKWFVACFFIKSAWICLLAFFNGKKDLREDRFSIDQENRAPVVEITAPKTNNSFAAGAAVQYAISVVDEEDGNSKFGEITNNEVLLEAKYFKDSLEANAASKQGILSDPQGLAVIRTSNCLNCHAFDNKLIGPSFREIGTRYNGNEAGLSAASKHIREGSSGIWGNISMPTHPELSAEQCKSIVAWINNYAALTDVSYYVGEEGSLRLKSGTDKKYLLLTASYTDHGTKEGNAKKKGQDRVEIKIR